MEGLPDRYCKFETLSATLPNNSIEISCNLAVTEKITKSQGLQGLRSIGNPFKSEASTTACKVGKIHYDKCLGRQNISIAKLA